MDQFVLKAPYSASGDQPQAIEALAAGIQAGLKDQILLGVTGSGKTFTMASVIEKVQKPTLVIAHNKTLAAQLTACFFSGQPGGILCFLLRLLSTRSIYCFLRYLY